MLNSKRLTIFVLKKIKSKNKNERKEENYLNKSQNFEGQNKIGLAKDQTKNLAKSTKTKPTKIPTQKWTNVPGKLTIKKKEDL